MEPKLNDAMWAGMPPGRAVVAHPGGPGGMPDSPGETAELLRLRGALQSLQVIFAVGAVYALPWFGIWVAMILGSLTRADFARDDVLRVAVEWGALPFLVLLVVATVGQARLARAGRSPAAGWAAAGTAVMALLWLVEWAASARILPELVEALVGGSFQVLLGMVMVRQVLGAAVWLPMGMSASRVRRSLGAAPVDGTILAPVVLGLLGGLMTTVAVWTFVRGMFGFGGGGGPGDEQVMSVVLLAGMFLQVAAIALWRRVLAGLVRTTDEVLRSGAGVSPFAEPAYRVG